MSDLDRRAIDAMLDIINVTKGATAADEDRLARAWRIGNAALSGRADR